MGRSEKVSTQLTAGEVAQLRSLMRGTIEGFATQGGAVSPLAPPHLHGVGLLVVLGSAPTVIDCGFVDVVEREEAFPIQARAWKPEPDEPSWHYQPPVREIGPTAADGLDLSAPLGRSVEISVLSIVELFGDEKRPVEIDVALVLAVDGWSLLIESTEHFDHPVNVPPGHLALSTYPETVRAHLSTGSLRSIGS